MMLSTTSLEPTHYDAVVFNFGMHDIDYSKLFPEVCRYYFIQLFLCSFRFILQIFSFFDEVEFRQFIGDLLI